MGKTTRTALTLAAAVSKTGRANGTVTFAVTAGSLPPGLSMSTSSGSSTAITGNPTQAGTFSFTVKAALGGLTSTLVYQITVTEHGPPDQLVCNPSANGGFLENGVCVLPDAVVGQSYQGHLVTSHKAGGTLSVVAGSLPPGLSLPATFTGSGDIVASTPTDPGVQPGRTFTVQGTGDQGQPLYQSYTILVDQNEPLSINASGGTALGGTVGQPFARKFTPTGSMATPRAGQSATLLDNGQVLVAGGLVGLISNPQTTAGAMLYHPDTNTWTGTGSMTTGRENQTATLLPDGQVVMAGGTLFDHPRVGHPGVLQFLASAELYNP